MNLTCKLLNTETLSEIRKQSVYLGSTVLRYLPGGNRLDTAESFLPLNIPRICSTLRWAYRWVYLPSRIFSTQSFQSLFYKEIKDQEMPHPWLLIPLTKCSLKMNFVLLFQNYNLQNRKASGHIISVQSKLRFW